MVLAALVVASGCGRVGFDDRPGDAAADTAVPAFSFSSLCSLPRHVVISDGLSIDDTASKNASAALSSACQTAPDVRIVSEGDVGVQDPVTGRPLTPANELTIVGGGDAPQSAIAYLQRADTPITWSTGSPAVIIERRTGNLVATGSTSGTHDYLMVFVVTEPIGGARVLSVQGAQSEGTEAAGYWFAQKFASSLMASTNSWVVVEWTDSDAMPRASAGDQYVVLASGL
jgi:hypothetical protein